MSVIFFFPRKCISKNRGSRETVKKKVEVEGVQKSAKKTEGRGKIEAES